MYSFPEVIKSEPEVTFGNPGTRCFPKLAKNLLLCFIFLSISNKRSGPLTWETNGVESVILTVFPKLNLRLFR